MEVGLCLVGSMAAFIAGWCLFSPEDKDELMIGFLAAGIAVICLLLKP